MARPKSWVTRIPHILRVLAANPLTSYDRHAVERLFSVSASTAKEILDIAGADEVRGVRWISAEKLRNYVQYCPEALELEQRQKRLQAAMRAEAEAQELRKVEIAQASPRDEWGRLKDLPQVTLEPGRLEVRFSSGQDLLLQLYRLSKALVNEPGLLEGR